MWERNSGTSYNKLYLDISLMIHLVHVGVHKICSIFIT
jgi:hypothetical protein